MKIGIIHLTDLHIAESDNWIEKRVSKIIGALSQDFSGVNNIYIMISGDIANKGEGFIFAESMLTKMKKSLERFYENAKFKYIIVPGNHDCNFNESNQVRDIIIEKAQLAATNEDNSIINTCLKVQDDFWNFYERITGEKVSDRLVYQIKDVIDNKIICFNCFNTAWMSSIKEAVGKMYFPVGKIPENINNEGCVLSISLFHHPLSWFTPNTDPNNRKEFAQFLEKNSQILIFGHEHEEENLKNQNLKDQKETIYISGKALQDRAGNSSVFKSIVIDIIEKTGLIKEYEWNKDKYTHGNKEVNFVINGAKNIEKKFVPKTDFLEKINTLNLPLKFDVRRNVKLSEIYVYPDLEKISTKERRIDEIYNSQRLLEEKVGIVSLEGESQSGKTSLLNMLFLDFLERDKYPILIEAKGLLKNNCYKIIERAIDEQYDNGENIYELFNQYDKSSKILLIDNLQDFTYNSQTLLDVIKEFSSRFNKIIIATTTIYTFSSALNSEFKNIDYFFIQPLGYKKRNELIEKYHILNESPQTVTDQIILEKTKYHFDQIQTVLGHKLIPSYPVYVLSILQTLIYATPHNLEQTSLGYCYQSLLYVALSDKAKIKNEDIDSYFNFLSELAFNLYETGKDSFSEDYLDEFYKLYSKKYVTKNLTKMKESLLLSSIVVEDGEGEYIFRYNYIFYFLISRKLVELINTEQGKDIIKLLCKNLSDEKSANILIFTTHHSKDNFLIDEATFSLMVPYDNHTPITLDTEDDYYNLIKDIVKEISSNIIQANKSPEEERLKALEESDKVNNTIKKKEEDENLNDDEEYSKLVEEMVHALKALEIVGQIIKNRKGSIDKTKLTDIITELYLTAFRTISFFGEISKLSQNELMNSLKKKIDKGDTNQEIEQKINKFFQYMTLQHCLGILSKVIFSVGNKDLNNIFDDVANKINTPAARIVTFSIKSCYGKMSLKELKSLATQFSNNPVALAILKARARAYVYNNHVKYDEKQQIASILKMKMIG